MPHMAPLLWLIMPTLILMIIYSQSIMLQFSQPTCFPNLTHKPPLFSSWDWTSIARPNTQIPPNTNPN